MAKVTGPLMSISASGSFAKTLVFASWKGVDYVRQHVIPTYSNTQEQQNVRAIVKDASEAWKAGATVGAIVIDAAYKLAYNTAAIGMAMSGFNLFIKETMDLNSGVDYDGSLEIRSAPIGV
jgi:hypothetical protein